jgi:hypothetical protein
MKISTASAKSKGRLFQNLVRDRILKLLAPYGVVGKDVKSTSMGVSGVDIQLSPFAEQFLPIAAECKSHKSMAIYKLWEQAVSNSDKDTKPVLFIKANHKEPLAILSLDDYMNLEQYRLICLRLGKHQSSCNNYPQTLLSYEGVD